MNFPQWVNRAPGGGRARRELVASNRLRYLVHRLALEHNPIGSVKQLAGSVGMHHSTFSIYIRRGHFSPAAATALEKNFGPDMCKACWLREPLTIETTAA